MPAPLPIYVVHSLRLSERRPVLERALAQLGWSAEWIERPAPLDRGVLGWLRLRPHLRLTRGEVSVYLKQREVLRRIAEGPDLRALVLEDDAVLPDDGDARLREYLSAAPADAGMLFLGSSYDLVAEPLPSNPCFGHGPRTRSLSGFVVSKPAAVLLTARLAAEPLRWPIDITIDRYIREGVVVAYWSVPPLIDNGSVTGRFRSSLAAREWRARPLTARLMRWWKRWRS